MLRVELHSHTAEDPVDRLSHTTFDLIDHAVANGFDALAITLHDRQLLLNFSRGTEDVRTFDDLRALKRRRRGLVVAPHPFFPASTCLWHHMDRQADVFDAVERNAMFTRVVDFNRRAKRWAARHGRPMVGNGDVHRLEQLGTTFIRPPRQRLFVYNPARVPSLSRHAP